MATETVTVKIPQTLYQRLEQAASRLDKPVENLLAETLQAALAATDEVPEAIHADVTGLDGLDESALQAVATSEMSQADQAALEQLLDLQSLRSLSDEETDRLAELRTEYGRVLLRKARAFALLAERGHSLSIE